MYFDFVTHIQLCTKSLKDTTKCLVQANKLYSARQHYLCKVMPLCAGSAYIGSCAQETHSCRWRGLVALVSNALVTLFSGGRVQLSSGTLFTLFAGGIV